MNIKASIKIKLLTFVFLGIGLIGCTALPVTVAPPPTATPTVTAPETEAAQPEPPIDEPPLTIGEAGMIAYHTLTMTDNTQVDFAVVLPENFDTTQTYPILLALSPGPQTKEMVQWGLDNYWAKEAIRRGWIVLSPVAPQGVLFFKGSEAYIPEFLTQTARLYRPEGGKYHVGGVSNGGISAFRVALNDVEQVHSITVLPGFPRSDGDKQRLETLTGIPVAMFVGEQDTSWVERMEATAQALDDQGEQVSLDIVAGEGHVIQSLTGGEALFDLLESFR